MKRTQVSSSHIVSVGYDSDLKILEVEYDGGGVYQYLGVSQEVYNGFLGASSKGQFLNANVKDSFPYVRVG